jgi:hypothetical protein
MREERFCAILFQAARKWLILNGEILDGSIEHARKTNGEAHRRTLKHFFAPSIQRLRATECTSM